MHHAKYVKTFFTFFIIFIKTRLLTLFIFLECYLFFSGKTLYPTKPAKILLNLLNSCIKRLLSDGFNMTAIKNSLMKSCSSHIKTIIFLRNFSVGIINFDNLSTRFFIYRFLYTFFILGVNVFTSMHHTDRSSHCYLKYSPIPGNLDD